MKNTKRKDSCFSPLKFSASSSTTIIGGEDIEYESLDTGNISSFDFHQYVVAHQFNLLLKLDMPELALMRACSFIVDAHKYIPTLANKEKPMLVDGWIFSAALAVSNTCNFYISCSKSDNSHSDSYLKIADTFLMARNELKRFGISRGMLDESASDIFGMMKAALAIIDRDFNANGAPDNDNQIKDCASEKDMKDSIAIEDEPAQNEEPSMEYTIYMDEPDTEYITNAIAEYSAAAHPQSASSGGSSSSSSSQGQLDKSPTQQPLQGPQPIGSTSRRMTFNFKSRASHADLFRNDSFKSNSSTSYGAGNDDIQLKSLKKIPTNIVPQVTSPSYHNLSASASPTLTTSSSSSYSSSSPSPSSSTGTGGASSSSTTRYRASEMDEMLSIEQFFSSLPPPVIVPKEKEDFSQFSDNPILIDAMKYIDSFDSIFIGISEKAQKAYNMANRPRASLNLFCEVALLYLYFYNIFYNISFLMHLKNIIA